MSGDLPFVETAPDGGILIRVKAVPGAKSDEIAGLLGDRLKVRTSAPPEGGKANKAIGALLAAALGVKTRCVELVSGAASTEKVFHARTVDASAARRLTD